MRPWQMIVTGFLLMLTSVVLPLLMVIRVIPSTFFLNFFSFGASVLGLALGIIGGATYIRGRRK